MSEKTTADWLSRALLAALLAACAWYLQRVTSQLDTLREDVTRLRIAVEVQAGGNPFEEPR